MEPTFSELMARPDIRYAIKLKELYWKQHYAQKYAMRFSSFFQLFAYHWIFHTNTLKRVNEHGHDLTQRDFQVLMAMYVMANAWATDNIFGTNAIYEAFFKDELNFISFQERIKSLRQKKLIVRILRKQITPKKRIQLKAFTKKYEVLFQLSDKAMEIPRAYNTLFGTKLTEFAKQNGELKASHLTMLKKLIKHRNDLAGNDLDIIREFDKILAANR